MPAPAGVAAGIDWPAVVGAKVCGPVIEPTGPMIESTWLAMKVLVWTGRSNVTLNWLSVSLLIRLSLVVETSPEVPTAWVVST